MTPEHFRELIDTVCMTTGASMRQIAHHLGKSESYFTHYRRCGVHPKKAGLLARQLREFCMEYKDKSFEPEYIPSGYKRKMFAS